MQNRMRKHPLTDDQIIELLMDNETGSLATLNEDGTPYLTPVHFCYLGNRIYIHGLPKGQKMDNILRDNRVSFCTYKMEELLLDSNEQPCDTNTKYESVIISGKAIVVEDIGKKEEVLRTIIGKYTPQLRDKEIPSKMIRGTAVIEIEPLEKTGKYYGEVKPLPR